MPDFVTDDDLSALAGEYVLGTLDPTERNRANVLLDVDQRFRGLVRVWERRFGELHLMVEPVAPDPKVWHRIGDKLGIGPAEPVLAPAPAIARVEAPAVAKPDVIKHDAIKPEMATPTVNTKAIEPEPEPTQVEVAGIEGDVLELGEARPERQLADLIEEVEKYTETMKGGLGGLPPPAPATADASTPNLEVKSEFELDLELEPEPEPELRSEPEAKPDLEPKTEAREPDLAEEREPDHAEEREPDHAEEREAAKGRKAANEKEPERTSLDAAAAALVAVEEAREHLRRMQERPPRVGRWRAVALLMTFVAAGLSGLIAAWRFAPAHLPEPLRPMAVLNIPEGQAPGERAPVEYGTQFEE